MKKSETESLVEEKLYSIFHLSRHDNFLLTLIVDWIEWPIYIEDIIKGRQMYYIRGSKKTRSKYEFIEDCHKPIERAKDWRLEGKREIAKGERKEREGKDRNRKW